MTATATTDASGINVTIPVSAGTGSIRLVASFAGDASNVPASTSVPVILYQPQSFVIWGGNAIPPHIGDHINFWGSQWDRQVTGGDYSSNASFKGWATPVASALVPCGVTGHANGTCWTSKPGNSSPPASIERYISVIVATSIVKNGGSIDGNIAAVVVVRVDASPAYGNDPGHPGYGTIVAVITDGARLFSTSTPAPSYAGYFFRHLATPRTQIASLLQPDLATLFSLTTPTARLTSVLHPTPLTVAAGTKRYSFYTPEMHLLAETALTSSGAPATAYEYIWFNGHPVAQIDAGAATHWTFTDHLGTPILLTNTDASTYWRAEYEPFGAVYALRSADVHQPLRLPGQEAEQLNLGPNGVTEREYNIFRWYRAGWGRYTQADPTGLRGGPNLFNYVDANAITLSDPLGLVTVRHNGTVVSGLPLDDVVRACHGANVKGCVLGRTDPVDCICRCNGGSWRASVTLTFEYRVYYATNTKIPANQIRAAELQHVSDIEVLDQITTDEAGRLEAESYGARSICEFGCSMLKLQDKARRLRYLAWDAIKGHDESGTH